MDVEIGSGGVEKEERGYTWQPEIKPTVFTAGWLAVFSLGNACQDRKLHSCPPSIRDSNPVWQWGAVGIGGTVAEKGGRKLGV